MGTGIKYFDYLPKYASKLESTLGLEPLEPKVEFWRTLGLGDMDGITVGCRKIVETSLRNLLELPSGDTTRFVDLIDEAFERDIIPLPIKLKCDQIRRRGNDGAHASVKTLEAKETLELLDDFLRWFVGTHFAGNGFVISVPVNGYDDELFMVQAPEDAQNLSTRASIAAALSGDRQVEKEVAEVCERQKKQDKEFDSALAEIAALTGKVAELAETYKDRHDMADRVAEVTENALETSDQLLTKAEQARDTLRAQTERIEKKVDDILSEYDYVRALLGGGASATTEQLDVMAFPKTKTGVKATVLQISGGAGTGKTLCLLAKLLRHVEADKAIARRSDAKEALFVCFNKNLAGHINQLLEECSRDFPFAKQRIAVRSYDQLINSLVRCTPNSDDPLRYTCSDVRYDDPRWSIHYENSSGRGMSFEFTREAMWRVAARHRDLRDEYYLDAENEDNAKWVAHEIAWLESTYGTPDKASGYVNMDARLGRGGTRRPDANVRKIVLEVWEMYYSLLASRKKYTIDQAANRLLVSNELPLFDAIAVDECQDLSSLGLRTLYHMRKPEPGAFMYVAGDESQKIYRRSFSWRALDREASCYGVTLKKNNRNPRDIAAFAARLIGEETELDANSSNVLVGNWNDATVAGMIHRALVDGDTVAVIGGALSRARSGLPTSRRLAQLNAYTAKGLEFDTVVVDYDVPLAETLDEEKRLRYVHFTRPRKKLIIRCSMEIPELMREYYPEFVDNL